MTRHAAVAAFVCALACAPSTPPGQQAEVRKPPELPQATPSAARPSASTSGTPAQQRLTVEDWDRAEKAIVRLLPSAFPALPQPVREDAEQRGCTIPQSSYRREPHNVIEGEFTTPKQRDWAILCSRNGVSSIVVYRRGTTDDVEELAASEDRHFLQASRRSIYFSHVIGVAKPEFIHRMNKAFDGGPLPPIDHDGIDDAFAEKASSIKYWHQGKWESLQGAD